jgi:mannose-6-phosphate isomerase-like protein (cupin superfamily)
MQNFSDYNTHLDIKFSHFEKIDIPEMVAANPHKWYNQTLTEVNGSDDEFFFVLEGQLLIDLEGSTIELNPQQGVTISKGVMHRPRAPIKTVMLMVETSAIMPTGD